jgi:hypothetical protein
MKDFVPYEQALALKELGFDEPCFGYHGQSSMSRWLFPKLPNEVASDDKGYVCSAPLYQQAFRWFREKHDLFGCIDLQVCTPSHWFVRIDEISKNDYIFHSEDENYRFNTYEEAELACLIKLIEIVKNKIYE